MTPFPRSTIVLRVVPSLRGSDCAGRTNKKETTGLSSVLFCFLISFFSPLPLGHPEIKEEVYRKDDRLLTLLKDVYVESRGPPVQVSVSFCRRHTSISSAVFKLHTNSVLKKPHFISA